MTTDLQITNLSYEAKLAGLKFVRSEYDEEDEKPYWVGLQLQDKTYRKVVTTGDWPRRVRSLIKYYSKS